VRSACYCSIQNVSSCLPSKNKTVILLVLYGCETWSVTLKAEHIVRVFGNRVLRRIFDPMKVEVP